MKLSPEQIAALARLSRLKVDDNEAGVLAEQMSKIMAMVEQVQKVDTSQLSEIVHLQERAQPLRSDQTASASGKLANDAAAQHEGYVVVPKVIK